MSNSVVITEIGVTTPCGTTREGLWSAFFGGKIAVWPSNVSSINIKQRRNCES